VTESIFKRQGRQVSFHSQSEVPLYVLTNEKSVFIILTNLLQNSLKYSKENTEVSVSIWRENSSTVMEVKDRGIGIDKDAQSKIFNPFFRENSPELGKVPGSGLGLSIVKKLCDHLGITVLLQSEKGQGTAIQLVFPNMN
jgi:signal transduction histidine kinase